MIRRSFLRPARALCCFLVFSACHNTRIDNLATWCEHITDHDLTERAPFWAVFPSVSFHYDEIRKSYVHLLDSLALEKVTHRSPRMVWQEGTTLHVESLSDLMLVEPDSVLAGWREGVRRGSTGATTDDGDQCVFGTAAGLYDTVAIHFGIMDPSGLRFIGDSVVFLPTGRKTRN